MVEDMYPTGASDRSFLNPVHREAFVERIDPQLVRDHEEIGHGGSQCRLHFLAETV